jgi:hypothetical protein
MRWAKVGWIQLATTVLPLVPTAAQINTSCGREKRAINLLAVFPPETMLVDKLV